MKPTLYDPLCQHFIGGFERYMQHTVTVLDHGFEFIGGDLATDFTNTRSGRLESPGHDHVQTYADVVEFVRLAGLLKPADARRLVGEAARHPEKAAQIHRRAVALREATFRAFERIIRGKDPVREDVELISSETADALGHAQMVKTAKGFDWDWPASDDLARPV